MENRDEELPFLVQVLVYLFIISFLPVLGISLILWSVHDVPDGPFSLIAFVAGLVCIVAGAMVILLLHSDNQG